MGNVQTACNETIDKIWDDIDYYLHNNYGICEKCGYLQDHVEPDAKGYTCDECGEPAVKGLELCLMEVL